MQRIIILFALSVLFSLNLQAASIAKFSDKVIDLPDIGTANSQQYAGYASTAQNCQQKNALMRPACIIG
ncbi:MAG: hypothetical protein P1U40_00545 [Coxiellaceae bacterium]|nr:hypothetical protein [Coxiellaceae bacterium]